MEDSGKMQGWPERHDCGVGCEDEDLDADQDGGQDA